MPSVYIVEDDPSVRKAIARVLIPLQCPVELFGSAEEFLAQARSDARGCLVLDVRLPGLSGLQLLEHLAGNQWKLPTIVISAEFTDDVRNDALRLGAICVMEKPIDRARFLATVHTAITDGRAG